MKPVKIKTKFKSFHTPGDILEFKLRDWYGNSILKTRVNVADKKRLAESFLTAADFTGIDIHIDENWKDRVKKKVIKRKGEDLEKAKKYFEKTKF